MTARKAGHCPVSLTMENNNKLSPSLALLLLLWLSPAIVSLCDAQVLQHFHNMAKQKDLCVNRCKDAPLPLINKDIDPERKYVTTCCERGCRFYNLVNFRRELEPSNLNNSLYDCDSSCTMAYPELQDLIACRIGCAFMANQRLNSFTPLFSIAIQIEDGIRPNILFSPDNSNNDILTDSGITKELLPVWWNDNGFKLPETYFKTIPIDTGSLDYGASSEYLGESEKSASVAGSDWLQCASRHLGVPRWILAFVVATAALSALWLCLTSEKPSDIDKVALVSPCPGKIAVYLPDEAPLHKKPPPKYDEVVNFSNVSLQV